MPWERERSKYKTRRTDGFHSKAESIYAAQLDLRKKAALAVDRISDYRCQVPFKLEVADRLIAFYVADFVVEFPDGHAEIHEVKGFETPEWRLKKKLFEALYPEWRLVIIPANSLLKRERRRSR